MRRHAKASSAASTSGTGMNGLGRFKLLGALVTVAAAFLVLAAPAFAGKLEVGYFAGDGTGPGGSGSEDGQLLNPGQADVNAASGSIYVADTGNNRVEVFDPTAELAEYDSKATISEPTGLAIDQDTGDVYVSNASGVSKFDEDLNPIAAGWTPPAATGPLTVDPSSGDLLVADTAANLIRRFESDGTAAGSFAAERPVDLAANSVGEVFVVTTTGDIQNYPCEGSSSTVKRFSSAGALEGTVGASLDTPGAVAVDPDDNSIVIASHVDEYFCEQNFNPGIVTFDAAGNLVETVEMTGAAFEAGEHGNSMYAVVPGLVAAGGNSTRIYVVTKCPFPEIYGATKVAVITNAAPKAAPSSAYPLEGGTKALLGGRVNPRNQATDYWFEYGTTDDYGSSVPSSHDGDAGSGLEEVLKSQEIGGLTPETTYHFRIVAENPTALVPGPDRTFTTGSSTPAPESCPNAAVRAMQSSSAADCRAWEMVSPLSKNFSDAGTSAWFATPVISNPDGNSAAYFSNVSFAGSASSSPGLTYLAKRGPDGWTNEGIAPPVDISKGIQTYAPLSRFISADLSKALFRTPAKLTANTPPTPKGVHRLYLRDNFTGTYQLVSVGTPTNEPDFAYPPPEAAAVTPDFQHILFTSVFAFDPDATTAEPVAFGTPNLYQWNADQPEVLELVGRLPGGGIEPGGAAAGGMDRSEKGSLDHVISDDGSRVFFTSPAAPQNGRGTIYVREDGETTVKVADDARYWSATPSGSKVLFTDSKGIQLYDFASETTTNISPDTAPEDGTNPQVKGIVQKSEDLSRVFFTSEKILVPGVGIPAAASNPQTHLYLSEDGVVSYLGTLSLEDTWGLGSLDFPNVTTDENQSAVTPDGSKLAFVSKAQLTAYDNGAHTQVYLYDADRKELSCASCPGDGSASQGAAMLGPEVNGTLVGFVTTRVDRHNFSTDGSRLFFQTTEALSPEDTNGATDIYEWSDGRARLISPGVGDDEKGYLFGGASPSGDDVFVGTRNQVVAADTDRISDVYDIRINGGIAAQNVSAPPITPCEGQQCRGAASVAPANASPATREVRGSKNTTTKRDKAKKKKHKAKKHNKKNKAKQHKKKQGKKKSKANHRAQRNG